MTATEMQRLLANRHRDAVYVPECKMGMAGSRTLDGWALLPTWSPLTSIGYEVKVSRSDWLRRRRAARVRGDRGLSRRAGLVDESRRRAARGSLV